MAKYTEGFEEFVLKELKEIQKSTKALVVSTNKLGERVDQLGGRLDVLEDRVYGAFSLKNLFGFR